jgi:hypothetical protein
MANAMSRKHEDIFTADEARDYLHLENIATLDHLRREKMLTGYMVGKQMMYWREDLDDCAMKMMGRTPPTRQPALKPLKPLEELRMAR